MAFTKLKLTTFGQTIEAKRHQGKGIKFTRVAIGDGLLGNGSMINRTELVSERHSMKIDGILTTDDGKQSVVVVTLDNSQFDEGFSYRELGLLTQDPDTQEEGVYLYDNAGAECEYLDTKDNGVVIYERLKLQIRVEQTENISFEASGNPLYLSAEDVEAMIQQHNTAEDAHPNKADLGEDGKVPSEQLPHMDYIPTTEKGKPGGVATLGEDGKVPAGQLPKMDYDPAGSAEAVQQALTAHTGNKNNPHAVTVEQVGALASSGGVMSGAISMSGHKIANLAAPTDLTDAAHKSYVDEHVDQTLKQKLGYKLIKEYTSPGSYTHTFDRKYTDVFVVVVGAGGGGGSSGERGGGGGGGGAVACFHVLDSSTIQNNNIVVGTGGAGAVSSLGPSVTNNGSAGGSSSAFGITVPGGSGGIANLGGMGGGYAPNEIVPGWLMIGGSGGSHNNNGDGDGNAGPIISIVGFKPFGGGGGGGGNPSLNDPPTPGGNGGDGGAGNGGAGATGQSNAIMGKNGTRGGGGGGGGAGWTFRSSEYKPSGIGGKGGDGYVAIYGRE
jgi:hypothetical protein